MSLMSEPIDRDARTGLYNQRFFRDALGRELPRARRHQHAVALILFDIDDFKQINDHYGHAAGNAILAALADRLGGSSAPPTSPAAWAATSSRSSSRDPLEDAKHFWARCQDELAGKPYEYAGPITLSCGIAEFEANEDPTALVSRVDLALHQAKIAGKAQLAIADPPSPQTLE